MKNRKELKADARKILKKHYWMLAALCLLAAVLGVEFTSSLSGTKAVQSENTEVQSGTIITGMNVLTQEFVEILTDTESGRTEIPKENVEKSGHISIEQDGAEKGLVLGRSRGFLAMLVNGVTSGTFLAALAVGAKSIVGSGETAAVILIVFSLAAMLLVSIFFLNTCQVVIRRLYLEGRCYDKVHLQRVFFLLKVRKWRKASITMLVQSAYQLLWSLTVIGGIIKYYSYILVPFIVAENPDIGANEAVTLSRRLMKGHKWECFMLEMSFLGWDILGALTFGIVDIFYVNPYRLAVLGEYYVNIRKLGKENRIEKVELLNDKYLYERPEEELLWSAYMDVLTAEVHPNAVIGELKGIRRGIADVFGVVTWNSKDEQLYEKEEAEAIRLAYDKEALQGKSYPVRLSVIPEKAKRSWVSGIHYIRHYSVWSILMFFFVMSMVGWLWEVSLHLLTDGNLVNRGVLHGPWLPIYGTGGVLILMLLNKLRKKPALEFFATILLCGSIEYLIAWYLERVYHGMKWWDYTGYFLNLDGRICAEGLLTFGLGGMMIVYILAPLFDNLIRRMPKKLLTVVCVVLIIVFCADMVYSSKHPNVGEGITDYQSRTEKRSVYVV